ncbi:suppressor of actin (sac)-related [Schistosoma mansoni]|uniref:suppressor of actin (sac)-related n=1 Tax=Schistosoma mansoni TaxID=6183 RepID=UPI0001A624A3|nr:suppressor of actin (sac)-related [Schistosoma mansoni]|eukprot:XP_018655511.1 suppressor of actin (sac)-related [Schistosoma mansoni]
MEVAYINWMKSISVYESPSHIYLVGSNVGERYFRILKIARAPVPLREGHLWLDKECSASEATVEAESLVDRLWRLNIIEDPHIYSKSELARILHAIQATSRHFHPQTSSHGNDKLEASKSPKWSRFTSLFSKRRSQEHLPKIDETSSISNSNISDDMPSNPKDLQQAAASALFTGSSKRSLVLVTKCYGVVGVVRFLRGYYLILITKYSVVAQLGEHQICKVEDTAILYIPGNHCVDESGLANNGSRSHYSSISSLNSTVSQDLDDDSCSNEDEQQTGLFHFIKSSIGRKKLSSDEMRYLKLFSSVDLASNFYFSYTYDLSHSLQYNMEPLFKSDRREHIHLLTSKYIPNDKYVWNWRLIPPRFRPGCNRNGLHPISDQPEWFTLLFHGSVSQIALSACRMPMMITLIARRSRHFAGRRFLKRGVNLVGDVANEVETEQIVHDSSYSFLRHGRVSSYVQMRGSVPLFWSQESSKVVVGRPPLEILRDDPFYESMGLHFASLLKRHGSPVIVLNLMKKREKRQFETTLSDRFERGITYLSQNILVKSENRTAILHLQNIHQLHQILLFLRFRNNLRFSQPSAASSKQCGIIRVNCVDCLDRTNTAQFVIGRVVLAYQLYGLGFLAEPDFMDNSQIDRLLQDLYDEHGDTLALQYGGSQLVHNINTYRKIKKLSSHSRDFVQTLSRYYSNKFSDWEKQCAISLFLRIYRPNLWSGTLYDFIKNHLIPRYSINETDTIKSDSYPSNILALFHSDTDQILASVAASLSGCIWDMCSDAYLHWLDAWARLPTSRFSLTDWCSRDLLQCLPRGMDITQKSDLYSNRCLVLPSNDIRVDWFNEFYELTAYVDLDRFSNPHIQSTELVVEHHLGDYIMLQSYPNPQINDQIHSHHSNNNIIKYMSVPEKDQLTNFSYPTLSNIYMDLGRSICAAHSFPNFTDIPHFDWAAKQSNLSSKYYKDGNNSNEALNHSISNVELNKTKKLKKVKDQCPINNNFDDKKDKRQQEKAAVVADDDGDNDEDKSSSDSDYEESIDNCINFFPPDLNLFPLPLDPDLSVIQPKRLPDKYFDNKGYSVSYPYTSNSTKRQKRKQITVGQLVKSKEDPESIYSNCVLSSEIMLNLPNKHVYEDYLRTDFTKHSMQTDNYYINNTLSSSSLLPIDKTSLDIYNNYVQMNNIGLCNISKNSMNIYKATAYLTSQLLY